MKRLHNLDYLRGLAASGIMVFHYMSGEYGQYNADTFLGRLGMYGVSVFYVLSGLTLFLVYHSTMQPSAKDIFSFAKKRFYRIFPLLWLATLYSIILSKRLPDLSRLFLNITGLFGVFKWDADIATGAWSIGNELVFYLFFPVFIFLLNKSKAGLFVLSLLIFSIYLYFAFGIINPDKTLTAQWKQYANPLNQLFLFLSGFLMGTFFKRIIVPQILNTIILIGGIAILVFYPVEGERILLATGFNRIVFTISCLMICFGFYKMANKMPAIINKPFSLLGEASYSVYLLHPLVYLVLKSFFAYLERRGYSFSSPLQITIAICLTLLVSYFVYERFEKFFMKKSHRINNR